MVIHIGVGTVQTNMTPCVIEALNKIKAAGGGELHFEAGEYHFYRQGAYKEFVVVCNNSACDKYIAFPIIDMKNLLIDGHGALFVFHDVIFPFMVQRSTDITLKGIVCDTGVSPLVEFKIRDITDRGFYMDLDKVQSPFFIKNGSLCFERESETVSGENEFFSLHALGRHQVQYFATGDCKADMTNLPAPVMYCDVTETPSGIYAAYRENTPSRCGYNEETVTSIIDGKRDVDVICLDKSRNITVCNVTVGRGIGMGIVGQLSRNITVDGFCADMSLHPNGHGTLTADSLHFINCDGSLEIKNCTISDTMDDAVNVHGVYTEITSVCEGEIHCKLKHQEQRWFNPYNVGDRLEIIDNKTFDIVAEFITESSCFETKNGTDIVIKGRFTYGMESVSPEFWVENPDRMPDIHIHHNHFYNFPNIRLSGRGNILVEDNHFSDCHHGLLCLDLAQFWYESGRIEHLVYRNNLLENGKADTFLRVGIEGIEDGQAPKVHGTVEISGNRFVGIKKSAVTAAGVKELIIKDNIFDN